MEDDVSTIPSFLQSPTNSLKDDRFSPQSTAHFFGGCNGHGGSQLTIAEKERATLLGNCGLWGLYIYRSETNTTSTKMEHQRLFHNATSSYPIFSYKELYTKPQTHESTHQRAL
ncbi:hypothetical protein YC2023_084281 [Brassica napus]